MNLREELYNHVVVEKKEILKAVDTAEMVAVNVVDSCRIFTDYLGVNKIRDVIFKTFESAFPNGDDDVRWVIYNSENGSAVHKKVTEDIGNRNIITSEKKFRITPNIFNLLKIIYYYLK